jgi:ABC-2 type transport system permease protein
MTDQLGVDASMMTMPDPAAIAQDDELGAVLSTLKDLNYGMLIFGFFVYFALGYLLYASFFAAIGSAVENEADTQQLSIPVTIPMMLGFFIAFYAFKAPDSAVVFWGSMIPFTSPIVMLARIPFGVPVWELALSIGLLVATFVVCGWASAKIYKIGILMFGKKTSFKDLWRWLRMK